MYATKKNEKIARQIINLLAEEKVSLDDAGQILIYAKFAISETSTVQAVSEKLFNVEVEEKGAALKVPVSEQPKEIFAKTIIDGTLLLK